MSDGAACDTEAREGGSYVPGRQLLLFVVSGRRALGGDCIVFSLIEDNEWVFPRDNEVICLRNCRGAKRRALVGIRGNVITSVICEYLISRCIRRHSYSFIDID